MITNQLDKDEKRWFAVATKYKCEKYVVRALEEKGITSYVPIREVTKKYKSKIKRYQLPLLHCYAFVHITAEQYVPVLETDYVYKFIKQRKDLLAIPDQEIELLRQIVGEYKGAVSLADRTYAIGEEVELISGDLTGLCGKVVDVDNKKSLVVELKSVGVQLLIAVKKEWLRPRLISV